MAQVRNVPPTHPTVYVGLGLATIGLLVALYAYTGSRVYDITFAFVAIVGGVLALVGILTAAWGRAVMSARASRQRRALISTDAIRVAEQALGAEVAPTIAAPAAKRRFDLSMGRRKKAKEPQAGSQSGSVFAFRRKKEDAAPVSAIGSALEAAIDVAPSATLEGFTAAAAAGSEEDAPQRVTVKCPDCGTVITSEGVRPLTIVCSCGFSDTL